VSEEEKAVALNQPSVVRIANSFCGELYASPSSGIEFNNRYPFCTASLGSGFVINKNGYIATNGHVVKLTDDELIRTAFSSKEGIRFYVEIRTAYLKAFENKIYTSTEKQLLIEEIISNEEIRNRAFANMVELYDKGIIIIDYNDNEIYVENTVNGVFNFDEKLKIKNADGHYLAKLIAYDYEEPETDEGGNIKFVSSDVAIIKIDATNLPTVKLGSIDDLNIASKILVLGFPGKAASPVISAESVGEMTVTNGIVSAIKNDASGERKLIQTDASLGHGNSGGPAIDINGNVIGIATYITLSKSGSGDEAADFNFLRDIQDLIDLAKLNNIDTSQSEVDFAWQFGLNYYCNYKFSKALEEFYKVRDLYPNHILVQIYIDRSEQAINNNKEKLEFFDYIYKYIPEEQLPWFCLAISGICLGLLVVILLTTIARLFHKRNKIAETQIPPIPQPETSIIRPKIQPLGIEPSQATRMQEKPTKIASEYENFIPSQIEPFIQEQSKNIKQSDNKYSTNINDIGTHTIGITPEPSSIYEASPIIPSQINAETKPSLNNFATTKNIESKPAQPIKIQHTEVLKSFTTKPTQGQQVKKVEDTNNKPDPNNAFPTIDPNDLPDWLQPVE